MSDRLQDIQAFLDISASNGTVPGAVAEIGQGPTVLGRFTAGSALINGGTPRPIQSDTIFDMASVTKVTVTLPLILRLAEQGHLSLGDPVSTYIPEFSGGAKDQVTLANLLVHNGGLLWHREYFRFLSGYDQIVSAAIAEPLTTDPNREVVYSDLDFILLGEVVRRVRDKSLAECAKEEIFDVVGMPETFYKPAEELDSRIAATEVMADGKAKVGIVHDDNTEAMGGESGHAGLFSTVSDMGRYLREWVNPEGQLLRWSTKIASVMRRTASLPASRGWGWVLRGDGHDCLGDFWPESSASHTGYTGTSVAFDLKTGIWSVLLTNRVHFGREHNIASFRRRYHNLVMSVLSHDY